MLPSLLLNLCCIFSMFLPQLHSWMIRILFKTVFNVIILSTLSQASLSHFAQFKWPTLVNWEWFTFQFCPPLVLKAQSSIISPIPWYQFWLMGRALSYNNRLCTLKPILFYLIYFKISPLCWAPEILHLDLNHLPKRDSWECWEISFHTGGNFTPRLHTCFHFRRT